MASMSPVSATTVVYCFNDSSEVMFLLQGLLVARSYHSVLRSARLFGLLRPPPARDIGTVDAIFIGVSTARDLAVPESLLGVGTDLLQPRDPVNGSGTAAIRDDDVN